MERLFSERYRELLQDESNWLDGDDDSSVSYSAKDLIARVMEDYREPIAVKRAAIATMSSTLMPLFLQSRSSTNISITGPLI